AATSHNGQDNSSFLKPICSKLGLNEDQCCKLSKTASFAIYAAAAAAVGTLGVPAVLASMGFTTTGITAGSWAAWYQATYGIGTVFSWLQSVSMTGTAAMSVTKAGVVVAAVQSYFLSDDCKKRSAEDNECRKNN
ncbi:unnamed protein product, partial [Rotaria sp. Silwood1]